MGDSGRNPKQKSLTVFFQSGNTAAKRTICTVSKKRRGSHFGSCPICERRFPYHTLEIHASNCTGLETLDSPNCPLPLESSEYGNPTRFQAKSLTCDGAKDKRPVGVPHGQLPTSEPIPGLFLYEDFITEDQEREIMSQLDGTNQELASEFLSWKPATFNGKHLGKRWGVHCNLRDRRVGAAENQLPSFVSEMLIPKLRAMRTMKGCVPNEANAIDYHKKHGHHLVSHVDDRKLSKEPIANLSLVGDCYMTFTNVSPARNTAVAVQRVLLKRRCLQILTGKARYDFSHGIANEDLLSERRLSITMRESPLTLNAHPGGFADDKLRLQSLPTSTCRTIPPILEPLPGLFLFPNFISEAEEMVILQELDELESHVKWSQENHTGRHREKRWGVDHDLWSRELRPPKHELPNFMHAILIPRFKKLICMKDCVPNEVNAIDYRKLMGHSLVAHVDDRQKHKEPIANLSLAGDCYMVYTNVKSTGSRSCHAVPKQKVHLQRRTLQVLTGSARYDYSHGIANSDLLSDRRVSVTMREMR